MSIKKLPNYIINKLKAGEIVERPSSVLKELVENSIDAGATEIFVNIENGGNTLIQIKDNGSGISSSDSKLVLERYTTSKIENEKDLQNLSSYGFRGEAIASIGEVSKLTIQTKTINDKVGTKIFKQNQEVIIENTPTSFDHGTNILIQDLFFNTPARQKFLKTPNTEYRYCKDVFFDFVLVNLNIKRTFIHNGKTIFKSNNNEKGIISNEKNHLKNSINQIYKKDRADNLHDIYYNSDEVRVYGVVSDSVLIFPTQSQIKIFVNKRPVEDKLIKKAILQAYHNQITPRMYPIAYLFLEIDSRLVDVNVHPRKKEVKFLDTQMIYGIVSSTIKKTLSNSKILNTNQLSQQFGQSVSEQKPYGFKSAKKYVYIEKEDRGKNNSRLLQKTSKKDFFQEQKLLSGSKSIETQSVFDEINNNIDKTGLNNQIQLDNNFQEKIDSDKQDRSLGSLDIKIIGQLRDLYIIAELDNNVLYIDQHALAERIAFEKMQKKGFGQTKTLLAPINISIPSNIDIDYKIEQLNKIGFECSLLSDVSLIIYSIPETFEEFPIDFEKVFERILFMGEINFDSILDKVFSTRSCRTSIKAGDKLSIPQMKKLIEDGFEYIPGSFVCPHGRPFFFKVDKNNIDKMFDR